MFNRTAAHTALFVLAVATALAGCSKTEQTASTANDSTPEAAYGLESTAKVSVPEKGILVEKSEFDFPELEENHKKNMARWKPVFDKYPPATSHTIVLDDGTKIEIPQKFQGTDLYKTKWSYETFTKAEFLAIDQACTRESRRFLIVASIIDLPAPLRILCQQAIFVKNNSMKSLR